MTSEQSLSVSSTRGHIRETHDQETRWAYSTTLPSPAFSF